MKAEIIYYFEDEQGEAGAFILHDDEDGTAIMAIKHNEEYASVIHNFELGIADIFYKLSEEGIIAIEDAIEEYKNNEDWKMKDEED